MSLVGQIVETKYSMLTMWKAELHGTAAAHIPICPTEEGKRNIKRIHIRDGRKISLPLTDQQKLQWDKLLTSWYDDHLVTATIRDRLIMEFWIEAGQSKHYLRDY